MPDLTDKAATRLTLHAAWTAAGAVRRADRGTDAVAALRPAGVSGIARGRGPVWLRLYLADRDGLLVWRDGSSFALLEPRASLRPREGGGPARHLLRTVDRYWDVFAFGVPPALLLLTALVIGLLRWSLALAILVVLAALVYVLVFVVAKAAVGLRWFGRLGRSRPADSEAAESAPAYQWSVPLLHQVNPDHADDLLRQVTNRVARIVERRLHDQAAHEGARLGRVMVHQPVLLLHRGITTAATRDRLSRRHPDRFAPFGSTDEISLVLSDGRPDSPAPRPEPGGGFALLYLFGVAVAIAVCATFIAAIETAVCGTADCPGRPTGWLPAVRYLLQRLLLSDPAGLSPAAPSSVVLGWFTSLLGVMAVFVFYVAGRSEIRRWNLSNDQFVEGVKAVVDHSRVLVLVVTPTERDAVCVAVKAHTKIDGRPRFHPNLTVHELGTISNADVLLAQAGEQGVLSEAAMAQTAREAISVVAPDYVLLVGICYGLWPQLDALPDHGGLEDGWQHLGDVLVSRRIQGLDHVAIREKNGTTRIVRRGVHVGPSAMLLDRCYAAQASWTEGGVKVHFGLTLSSNTLFDSEPLIRQLREEFPDAIGGEMEAIGVYESATGHKVDWIMIKAICDWGYAKTSSHHPVAARNAAEFVTHLIGSGALDHRRST